MHARTGIREYSLRFSERYAVKAEHRQLGAAEKAASYPEKIRFTVLELLDVVGLACGP